MSYNSVGRPKFYIDAFLLARQLGHIAQENFQGKSFLNPVNTTDIGLQTTDNPNTDNNDIAKKVLNFFFSKRQYYNSITHCFILGHRLLEDNLRFQVWMQGDNSSTGLFSREKFDDSAKYNGWTKLERNEPKTNFDATKLVCKIEPNTALAEQLLDRTNDDPLTVPTSTPIGDISVGWSYLMTQSPDLELTQTFSNESLKVQTTKGGATLTNKGWNQPPKWGIYPQWKASPNDVAYPTRRSWNLKFSFISDEKLMPQFFNELDTANSNRGIFERTTTHNEENDPFYDELGNYNTDDPVNPRTTSSQSFTIKDNFLTKVYAGTNGFQLPFIFQPDHNVEEYAICRVNQDSVVFTQEAFRVYSFSCNIIEVW